jgi:hypothetical protein
VKNIKESTLYPAVANWLEESKLCFTIETNKGLYYTRFDVVGVKDVGGDLSGEIETIAIEVKNGTEPFSRACGQALAYKIYVNRIYLADTRNTQFHPEEIQIASHLGIGLIQIQNGKCKEILSSPYYVPVGIFNLWLLENLYLGKCQFCGCFFEIGEKNNKYKNVSDENIKKALKDGKGLRFWNRKLDDRKRKVGISVAKEDQTLERRFICPDCIKNLFSK